MNTRALVCIAALLLAAGGIAAACTSDTDELEARIAALEQQDDPGVADQIAALQEQVTRTQMIAAVDILDGAELHAIDEAANEAGSLEEITSGPVRGALLAVTAAQWSAELEEPAAGMAVALRDLLVAIESGDLAVIGPAAATAHDTQHNFSELARNTIGAAVGLEAEEHDE